MDSGFDQPIVSLTEKGEKLKSRMQGLLFVHVLLAVTKMFILNPFSSVGDFISCMILFCGVSQHNFCYVLMYMIMSLFDVFSLGTTIGYMA